MFQTKVVEKIKIYILCSVCVFPKVVTFMRLCGKIWYRQTGIDENIIHSMRIACWITKATNTDPDCVILIAFPQQLWLHERALILCYAYTACLVLSGVGFLDILV